MPCKISLFYCNQKWSKFELEDISLEIHDAAIYKKPNRHYSFSASKEKNDKKFVVFDIKMESHERPFLLSRDLVFARPPGCKIEPFQESFFKFSFLPYTTSNNYRKLRHFLNLYKIKHQQFASCLPQNYIQCLV